MDANTLVHPRRRRHATRVVRSDNQNLVALIAEMLRHPKNGVDNTVDIREKRLRDNCNAHTKIVSVLLVCKVACGDTTHEDPVPIQRLRTAKKGRLTCHYRAPRPRWRSLCACSQAVARARSPAWPRATRASLRWN